MPNTLASHGSSTLPVHFPSLKANSSTVERARLPPKPRSQSRLPPSSAISLHTLPTSHHSTTSSRSTKSNQPSSEIQNTPTLQWQLQIVCGPGHDHNNFESQRAGTKFKAFEVIGEQIWRPSLLILDEAVQSSTIEASLNWPDFLRFRVLEETTPWEHWYTLYTKEHSGRKPLMRNCYLTHGWNKQSKTPIWLPRDARTSGTLRNILEKWFPLSKDKVTIIFEYINKDHVRTPVVVPASLKGLSIGISDHELTENASLDMDSSLLHSHYSSSYRFSSSPPLPSISTKKLSNAEYLPKDHTNDHVQRNRKGIRNDAALLLISSSDPELPSIEQLIATTLEQKTQPPTTLDSKTLEELNPVSSPLSTIPDSPNLNWDSVPPSPPLPNSLLHTSLPLHRTTSKVILTYPFPVYRIAVHAFPTIKYILIQVIA